MIIIRIFIGFLMISSLQANPPAGRTPFAYPGTGEKESKRAVPPEGQKELKQFLKQRQQMMKESFKQMDEMMKNLNQKYQNDPFFKDFFNDPFLNQGHKSETPDPLLIEEFEDKESKRHVILIKFRDGHKIPLEIKIEKGLIKLIGVQEIKERGKINKIRFERSMSIDRSVVPESIRIEDLPDGLKITYNKKN